MVEIHFADDRTQRRHDHVADRLDVIFHAIDGFDRVGDLDKGDRIDDDDGVVAGNDFLFLHIKDDVLGCDPVGYRVEIGDDEAQARQQRNMVFAQALNDPFLALRHNAHALGDRQGDKGHKNQCCQGGAAYHDGYSSTLMKLPSTATMRTRVPDEMGASA